MLRAAAKSPLAGADEGVAAGSDEKDTPDRLDDQVPHATVLEPLQSAEHLKDGLKRELAGIIQFRAVLDCSLQSIVHGQQQSAVFSGGEDDVVIDVGVVSDGVEVGFVQEKVAQLSQLEKELTTGAADQMDRRLLELADMMEQKGTEMPMVSPELLRGITKEPEAVTGEHVGRMLGRVAGDEIGVLGGVALGGLVASQLGVQSPKDAEIARLKQQLGQG